MRPPGLSAAVTCLRNEVVAAADSRCQCAGQCGRAHQKGAGRCHVEDNASHWLVLAPAEGNASWQHATHVEASELCAWCGDCLHRVDMHARAAAADREVEDQIDLFTPSLNASTTPRSNGVQDRKAS